MKAMDEIFRSVKKMQQGCANAIIIVVILRPECNWKLDLTALNKPQLLGESVQCEQATRQLFFGRTGQFLFITKNLPNLHKSYCKTFIYAIFVGGDPFLTEEF